MKRMIIAWVLLFFAGGQSLYAQQREAYVFTVKNPDRFYIGGLLETDDINKDEHAPLSVEQGPVTVSSSLASFGVQTFQPAYATMMDAVRKSLEGITVQTDSYRYIRKELQSYDDIASEFGQKVDVYGYAGTDTKTRHTLVMASFTTELFNLDMDFPEEDWTDTVSPYRREDLIYVLSVSFGRQVIVLVESDDEAATVMAALDEALNEEKAISSKSKAVLADADIRIIWVGEEGMGIRHPSRPFADVTAYLKRPCTADDFGKPIRFRAAYLKDNSVFINKW